MGENTKLSGYGYPDMGNNVYSDELPYSDWFKINNAQRCHESSVQYNPIIYPCILINALSFPKYTFYLTLAYVVTRFTYIQAYNSNRGYNKALASDEMIKFFTLIYVGSAFASSFRIIRGGR